MMFVILFSLTGLFSLQPAAATLVSPSALAPSTEKTESLDRSKRTRDDEEASYQAKRTHERKDEKPSTFSHPKTKDGFNPGTYQHTLGEGLPSIISSSKAFPTNAFKLILSESVETDFLVLNCTECSIKFFPGFSIVVEGKLSDPDIAVRLLCQQRGKKELECFLITSKDIAGLTTNVLIYGSLEAFNNMVIIVKFLNDRLPDTGINNPALIKKEISFELASKKLEIK